MKRIVQLNGLTLRSTRTPPGLPSALSAPRFPGSAAHLGTGGAAWLFSLGQF